MSLKKNNHFFQQSNNRRHVSRKHFNNDNSFNLETEWRNLSKLSLDPLHQAYHPFSSSLPYRMRHKYPNDNIDCHNDTEINHFIQTSNNTLDYLTDDSPQCINTMYTDKTNDHTDIEDTSLLRLSPTPFNNNLISDENQEHPTIVSDELNDPNDTGHYQPIQKLNSSFPLGAKNEVVCRSISSIIARRLCAASIAPEEMLTLHIPSPPISQQSGIQTTPRIKGINKTGSLMSNDSHIIPETPLMTLSGTQNISTMSPLKHISSFSKQTQPHPDDNTDHLIQEDHNYPRPSVIPDTRDFSLSTGVTGSSELKLSVSPDVSESLLTCPCDRHQRKMKGFLNWYATKEHIKEKQRLNRPLQHRPVPEFREAFPLKDDDINPITKAKGHRVRRVHQECAESWIAYSDRHPETMQLRHSIHQYKKKQLIDNHQKKFIRSRSEGTTLQRHSSRSNNASILSSAQSMSSMSLTNREQSDIYNHLPKLNVNRVLAANISPETPVQLHTNKHQFPIALSQQQQYDQSPHKSYYYPQSNFNYSIPSHMPYNQLISQHGFMQQSLNDVYGPFGTLGSYNPNDYYVRDGNHQQSMCPYPIPNTLGRTPEFHLFNQNALNPYPVPSQYIVPSPVKHTHDDSPILTDTKKNINKINDAESRDVLQLNPTRRKERLMTKDGASYGTDDDTHQKIKEQKINRKLLIPPEDKKKKQQITDTKKIKKENDSISETDKTPVTGKDKSTDKIRKPLTPNGTISSIPVTRKLNKKIESLDSQLLINTDNSNTLLPTSKSTVSQHILPTINQHNVQPFPSPIPSQPESFELSLIKGHSGNEISFPHHSLNDLEQHVVKPTVTKSKKLTQKKLSDKEPLSDQLYSIPSVMSLPCNDANELNTPLPTGHLTTYNPKEKTPINSPLKTPPALLKVGQQLVITPVGTPHKKSFIVTTPMYSSSIADMSNQTIPPHIQSHDEDHNIEHLTCHVPQDHFMNLLPEESADHSLNVIHSQDTLSQHPAVTHSRKIRHLNHLQPVIRVASLSDPYQVSQEPTQDNIKDVVLWENTSSVDESDTINEHQHHNADIIEPILVPLACHNAPIFSCRHRRRSVSPLLRKNIACRNTCRL